jgi:predicted TIM-barrel fold metal-dependent hydrolase
MVDTHIHLFDPTRPQGAPYRGPRNSPVYESGCFPATFRKTMAPYNAVAAIHVDASPWVEDNLWMLQSVTSDPVMVGAIGNLRIEDPDFPEIFDRFARDPFFLGLRYGNLWGYDLVGQSRNALFLGNLQLLADRGLVLDTANPRVDLLEAVVRVTDAVPGLRIIVDHLCKLDPAPGELPAYHAVLEEISHRPSVYVKLSSSLHAGNVDPGLAAHKDRLDLLFETFGSDRVLYASDWPNVEGDAPVGYAINLIQEYFASKSAEDQAKFFWRNSIEAYRWKPRTPEQAVLAAGSG